MFLKKKKKTQKQDTKEHKNILEMMNMFSTLAVVMVSQVYPYIQTYQAVYTLNVCNCFLWKGGREIEMIKLTQQMLIGVESQWRIYWGALCCAYNFSVFGTVSRLT